MMEKKKLVDGKVIIIGFTLLLVSGVVVSIILLNKIPRLDGTKLTISTICKSTDYKDTCLITLAPYNRKPNATMHEIIHCAIETTLVEWHSVFDMYNTLLMGFTDSDYTPSPGYDPPNSDEGPNCMFLLNCTRDNLQAALLILDDESWLKGSLPLHAAELNSLLSATVSYQETCLDGILDDDLALALKNGAGNFTRLTSNALSIVTQISNNCTTLETPLRSINSRKLLEEETIMVSDGGYPAWVPAATRKLLENGGGVTPDVVVAKDGSGKFKTITEALAAYPKPNPRTRYVIYVKAGTYPEQVIVEKNMVNVVMYGDGPEQTMVTGWKTRQIGYSIMGTATFSVVGQGFIAKSMGFHNTGPTGEYGVALRVQSDLSAFFNCRMDGHQNTLFAQANRQFYRDSVISGSKDIIFGDSATVIQNSVIIVRKPANTHEKIAITAHGRSDRWETTGSVLQNCSIVPDKELLPMRDDINVYLGSPMKKYARTIVMESTLGDFINPEGWMSRDRNDRNVAVALNTSVYAEYSNVGLGANTTRRVRWKGYKVITDAKEALQYTVQQFIQGSYWLMPIGEPVLYDLNVSNTKAPFVST